MGSSKAGASNQIAVRTLNKPGSKGPKGGGGGGGESCSPLSLLPPGSALR